MGQSTAFDRSLIKSSVLILGQNEINEEARYIHGQKGKGFFTFLEAMIPKISSTVLVMNLRFWTCIPIHRV
jgi:hypothetical protein